jgi:hypothetical protein
MKKLLIILALLPLAGCVEFAWRSSGHFATQAPDVDLKALTYRQPPIRSYEVVNHNVPVESTTEPTGFSSFEGR